MNLSITQLCEKYLVSADTIRYYEKISLLPTVPRNNSGRRYYDDGMQKWIEMILCLRNSGVPIKVLQEYVDMIKQGDKTLKARQLLLSEQEKALIQKQRDLQISINRLHHKVNLYKTGEIKQHKNYFEEYQIAKDLKNS
ncbi:MerR family transcriptional regulator [Apilactobacillus micheneri]|uniref:MerR family transcriptional regulator n=1 Tax=Apilactobacillus micheneri TaxID=1899430 RepID=A0A9Q8MUD6_9LACO|nr:MerR family transcriptional regulator [Apilactobacillus micheneri]TPR40072.1 MerR family transcriptional regulator [Apilactobacillus micheneri]TPR41883.1 MerR family transcriptional regulator [Apilactobacillus micheneri]TPR44274.1 MerR family transcriptional regulator [Apilactobacillus micheneri]TPR45898.1 MerR family transcriptional regulator [Apilactobacillus micheneri]TPR51659.1 MerR family transcriptional regulator [Apilactobacillus micheneri]